eukprot:gnl/MRDRNA2_/MRDRNA2_66287_c0_seq2.p1 gnl/MRDRNA2_/MRDRNA2_66287_c0~~gnl/MRDRNA2_/MRDRNA2_66287_c0_seq2.p1  ORF type:complete len:171 (-),score=13.58 gnl/MRDRNA2_/MRDRNA2_66287_c0_seq2:54-566(-)
MMKLILFYHALQLHALKRIPPHANTTSLIANSQASATQFDEKTSHAICSSYGSGGSACMRMPAFLTSVCCKYCKHYARDNPRYAFANCQYKEFSLESLCKKDYACGQMPQAVTEACCPYCQALWMGSSGILGNPAQVAECAAKEGGRQGAKIAIRMLEGGLRQKVTDSLP